MRLLLTCGLAELYFDEAEASHAATRNAFTSEGAFLGIGASIWIESGLDSEWVRRMAGFDRVLRRGVLYAQSEWLRNGSARFAIATGRLYLALG